MRELVLTVLIVVASHGPVQTLEAPTMPPSTYPSDGAFCGFMSLCTPKAAAPRKPAG